MSRWFGCHEPRALSTLWCGLSASAELLHCQSINGNLNCAGSSGLSCQTINGKKVCVSGHGDVIQSFGGDASAADVGDEEDPDERPDMRQPPRRHVAKPHPYTDRELVNNE